MSHHKLEIECACSSCKATGLYVGMGERDGAAIQCAKCHGTGQAKLVIEYDDFEGRQPRKDVKRVYESNPGICIGTGNGHRLEDFGGIPVGAWERGDGFERRGNENRAFTCPAWWYQSADYKRKPNWKECGYGSFSACSSFPRKAQCWARFDAEGR